MDLSDLAHDLFSQAFSQTHRALRLRFASRVGLLFEGVLIPQRIDIREAVCDGLTAHLTCLVTRADLPLAELLGLPVEVQLVTDVGSLRRFCVP